MEKERHVVEKLPVGVISGSCEASSWGCGNSCIVFHKKLSLVSHTTLSSCASWRQTECCFCDRRYREPPGSSGLFGRLYATGLCGWFHTRADPDHAFLSSRNLRSVHSVHEGFVCDTMLARYECSSLPYRSCRNKFYMMLLVSVLFLNKSIFRVRIYL